MAVSFKVFRLIRWSASTEKARRPSSPQIRRTLSRVGRKEDKTKFRTAEEKVKGDKREQRKNVRVPVKRKSPGIL